MTATLPSIEFFHHMKVVRDAAIMQTALQNIEALDPLTHSIITAMNLARRARRNVLKPFDPQSKQVDGIDL